MGGKLSKLFTNTKKIESSLSEISQRLRILWKALYTVSVSGWHDKWASVIRCWLARSLKFLSRWKLIGSRTIQSLVCVHQSFLWEFTKYYLSSVMTYEIEMEERVFTDIWLVILEVWIGDTNSAKSFIKNAYLLLLHALPSWAFHSERCIDF